MFYRYEIKQINNEEVLYLYLTMAYEFSKELGVKASDEDITRRTKNFVKNNHIQFNGSKAFLIIDGIIVKTVELKTDEEVELIEDNTNYEDNQYLVTVELDNKIIVEITLKEYLLGVLATNTLPGLELETLKALAVLYRTFAFQQMESKKMIKAINKYQIYKPLSYYKLVWINDYHSTYHKMLRAIQETDKEFITYEDKFITPFVHLCNNGYTSSDKDFPYLEKRPSLWDMASSLYLKVSDYDYEKLEKIFDVKREQIKNMQITSVTDSNRIAQIKIGEHTMDGISFKNLLNLPSDDITIIINQDQVRFITRGYGIGLGLSEFGANEMAKSNCNYIDIIHYYYPKITIKRFV